MNSKTATKFVPAALVGFGLLVGACGSGAEPSQGSVVSLPVGPDATAETAADLLKMSPDEAQLAFDECYDRLGFGESTAEELADDAFQQEQRATEADRMAQAKSECDPFGAIADGGYERSPEEDARQDDAFLAQDNCMAEGGFPYTEDLEVLINSNEANRIDPATSADRLRVPDAGDEITNLALTLNGMLGRLDAGLERQRQFVSDASHELRSPLTVIKGASELLGSTDGLSPEATPIVTTLQNGARRLELILDDLTQLAGAGLGAERVDADLDVVVLAEVEAVMADYSEVKIDVSPVPIVHWAGHDSSSSFR